MEFIMRLSVIIRFDGLLWDAEIDDYNYYL